MKTFQTLLFAFVLAGSLGTLSCKKDSNDPQPCNYVEALQSKLDAVNAASTAYANNPTTENCNAYKAAWQSYLNEAEKYVDCANTAGQGTELQSSIDQAQAAIDAIQC